jgi:hypothetical protein
LPLFALGCFALGHLFVVQNHYLGVPGVEAEEEEEEEAAAQEEEEEEGVW